MLKRLCVIFVAFTGVVGVMLGNNFVTNAKIIAEGCADLRLIFARGSGEIWQENESFLAFKQALEPKLQNTTISYDFIDLNYPAVSVGLDNVWVAIGAFMGAGNSYQFGDSVNIGAEMLSQTIKNCPNTKYVLGGYSQGALVVSKVLPSLQPNQLIFAATFGDPKLYLPEGAGLFPAACRNQNLSNYRFYVPDCHAYEGLLGSTRPYEPSHLSGKIGTWCNKKDIMCSSGLSIDNHTAYVADSLYEDASKIIFDKITTAFDIENTFVSPHDTAILIDSTGSMQPMINQYKTEALRLAKKTLDSGGRIALYDYRDLNDPYVATKRCDFETCTLDVFTQQLRHISTGGGGDKPESLLSSSLKVMKELNWQYGATKSIIVLTDSDFLLPDRDGTTLDEVVKLSHSIDPVNFYVITTSSVAESFSDLTALTDGKIETDFDKLSLLTDYIMERYDSLPRVEASDTPITPVTITDLTYTKNLTNKTIFLSFSTDAEKIIVILNDVILGTTSGHNLTISDIDFTKDNFIRLIPINNGSRGIPVDVTITKNLTLKPLPDVPNTGQI